MLRPELKQGLCVTVSDKLAATGAVDELLVGMVLVSWDESVYTSQEDRQSLNCGLTDDWKMRVHRWSLLLLLVVQTHALPCPPVHSSKGASRCVGIHQTSPVVETEGSAAHSRMQGLASDQPRELWWSASRSVYLTPRTCETACLSAMAVNRTSRRWSSMDMPV